MLPQTIRCEECGRKAVVRGYGRVEYDWSSASHGVAALNIKAIRLTIDCPKCGVRVQEHRPVETFA
jgi:DNA-directed RNA polymerase subunit RPC12/RpoP